MIPEINAAVQQYPNLRLQVNKHEYHRVTKNGVSRGSLWLAKQSECYRLKLTGDIAVALRGYVLAIAGDPAYADQGVDVWRLPFDGSMEKIMRKLAETDA
jgi:hypothetical protein